jgi:hypothetical protein
MVTKTIDGEFPSFIGSGAIDNPQRHQKGGLV